MNRKLVVVVAVAAVLALLAGAAVGRNLLSPEDATVTGTDDVVRFKDPASEISIAYPATWKRQPDRPQDPELVLLAARDASASLLVRVSPSGLDAPVTQASLPIVRKYTDSLLSVDQRAKQLTAPVAVGVGGLPGWRYRYTFGDGAGGGAHDHYFLFKEGKLVQLVFQAVPAKRLPALAPTFDSIAESFRGRDA